MIVIDQEDAETVLDQCNECGVLIPTYNPLCEKCRRTLEYEEQLALVEDHNSGCWSY